MLLEIQIRLSLPQGNFNKTRMGEHFARLYYIWNILNMHSLPEFSDLYLPNENPMSGHLFPGPEKIPEELREFVYSLVEKANMANKVDFAIEHLGIFLRGHKMPTITGVIYIFRRMPSKIWTMEDCSFPKYLRDYMLSERLSHGGLIIVAGMPGNGKSTSCAAMVVERLRSHGGLCITIEDPPEMPLQGMHNKGICLQREVDSGEGFHEAVKDAMRGYPSQVDTMMLIGEVRDPETASLAIRSSIDGRLVFITTHAGNVIQALHRITSLAAKNMGQEESRDLIASSLRLVIHQQIENGKLKINTLFDTNGVAGVIRNKDTTLESLINEQNQQRNRLKMGLSIDVRDLD